jgi:amino acid transporter
MPNGLAGVAVVMGLTFIAFEGYEVIVQSDEEVRIPKGVFQVVVTTFIIYSLINWIVFH